MPDTDPEFSHSVQTGSVVIRCLRLPLEGITSILWKSQFSNLRDTMKDQEKTKDQLIEDLTALRLSFAELEQHLDACKSVDPVRAMFDTSRDCVYLKDTELRFRYINPAMATVMGRAVSEIIGRLPEELYGEEAAKPIREFENRILAGKCIQPIHTRIRPVRGGLLTFREMSIPVRNQSGDIVGIFGVGEFVSGRKKGLPAAPVDVHRYPSEAMHTAMVKARSAARTNSIVLLQGESGSGKDYLARWIHDHSSRSEGPFFAINCAAVPHELAESELFGHEAGGFTGAQGRKRGLLELAEGGTLLLNEIGELSLPLQSKLLTFLDTRSFLRVGGEKAIRVNARLIAATHRDLREEVAKRLFLQPLFYRLAVFCIEVPPLRERKEDIPTLVREIMEQLATEMEMSDMPLIQEDAVNALTQYHWPGNIRELRNVLENALALSEDGTVDWRLLSLSPGDPEWCHKICFPENRTLHQVTDEVMSSLCAEALRRSHGNRKQAAELLGISRYTLYRYLKYYGLEGEKVTQELAAV